ncbi:MAG: phosphoenolpyruvate--protein phosphotransferase [Actinobacteria bacterium]|nr:phosphoenolpyruvate--protein phosphotransferase [Actinomycetota bacterium]
MVGLVLVCHSARLAESVAELAAQVAGKGLRIGVAGGLDLPGSPLGTDAVRVARAIGEVWSEDGVLVLMDLGSAVLSAEMALDLLPEEWCDRILLTEAPLVEGAVAAAVAAGLGDSLQKVAEEARGALAAKAAHLGSQAASTQAPAAYTATGATLQIVMENTLGLHMRPAALLVRTAAGFDAEVAVANLTAGRAPVSARSLNAVATLGVRRGDEILLRASGPQADEALAAVRLLADDNWGDPREGVAQAVAAARPGRPLPADDGAVHVPALVSGTVLQGLPASPGIAVGGARCLRAARVAMPDSPSQDRKADGAALERAVAAAAEDIRGLRESVAARAGSREAAIFDAHLLFLEDEALLGPAREGVKGEGKSAARAWADAVEAAATSWDALDDPYLRARAADLRSVGDQVLRRLLDPAGGTDPSGASPAPGAPGIVVAPDLSPTEAAGLDPAHVLGVACAFGGPTSHGAILARSLGIPAVVGAGRALLGVAEGTVLALDGEAGTVTVDPPAATVRALEARRAERAHEVAEAQSKAHDPAVTRDGTLVHVEANVAGPQDIGPAVAAGADGVGLLRTEFLFLTADHLPTEDEQERAYRAVAEALGGRPLTLRTLDVGADKPLPYLPLEREPNPNLGLRGIRLGLSHPEVLTAQLCAALRVAADQPLRVMFPMVATADEVRRARLFLDEARATLIAAGVRVPERIEVGIMVEVPAAALLVQAFVPLVDFFSLGTNDLAQCVLAADRGNAAVAALADALHPAVLRLIDTVARAAEEGGRSVAVCGEMAGDLLAIPLLLGLGITELSMAAARIPLAKQAVRATDRGAARRLAARALDAESAADVRRLAARAG